MAFVSQRETTKTYTFSSRPRAVENRTLYREAPSEESQHHYGNIMYDRRVVRGNTYAQRILPATTQAEFAEMQRQQEQRRKAVARRRARDQVQVRTPEALKGRQHLEVQTELYLEELSNTVMESDVHCQTDSFLDRPVTPLFVPAKSGVDAETQIEDGELFDFDREVQGLLEVLVGKVMEQSLFEVMEEEELASLCTQQRVFEEKRNAHLCEVQRLQEQERRHTEEKKRRMEQQREVLKKEREIAQKVAARAYTQQHLANLVPSIFTSLRCHGFFVDTVQTDVETNFMPWLMKEIHSTLDKRCAARSVLDNTINEGFRETSQVCVQVQAHSGPRGEAHKKPMRTMGPAKLESPSPENFLKKHSKEPKIPHTEREGRINPQRKPPVPTRTEMPLMRIQTKRDITKTHTFVTSKPKAICVDTHKGHKAALENSGLVPKYIKKTDFGKVPAYLQHRNTEKQKAQEQYDNYVKEQREKQAMKQLSEEERRDILQGLKRNWDRIHHEYQGLSLVIVTSSKRAHKERLEADMKRLEKDIDMFERFKIIYIADN